MKEKVEAKKLLSKINEYKGSENFNFYCEVLIEKIKREHETEIKEEIRKKINEKYEKDIGCIKNSLERLSKILEEINSKDEDKRRLSEVYNSTLGRINKVLSDLPEFMDSIPEDEIIKESKFKEFLEHFKLGIIPSKDELKNKEEEIINYLIESNPSWTETIVLLKYLKDIDWKIRVLEKEKNRS